MAEVLGAVASGLSIAELALKTVHAGVKLAELWRGLREFPEGIQRRLRELEILAMHLQDLERDQASSPPSSALYMARVQCHTCLTDLQKALEEIQSRIQQPNGIKRNAAVAGIMLKGDVLARVDGRLASSLESLSFAGQMHSMQLLKSQNQELRLLRQQIGDIVKSRKPNPPKFMFDLMTWSDCEDSRSDSGSDWTYQVSTQPSLLPVEYYTERLASLGSERLTGCLEVEANYITTKPHHCNDAYRIHPDMEQLGGDDEHSYVGIEVCVRAKSPSWLSQSRLEIHFATTSPVSFSGWKRLFRAPKTTNFEETDLDLALIKHAEEGDVRQLTILLDSNAISLDEYTNAPMLVVASLQSLRWQTVNLLLDRGAQALRDREMFCSALPEFPTVTADVYDICRRDAFWEETGDGLDALELQRLIKREHRNNFLPVSLFRNYRGSAQNFNHFRKSIWPDAEYYDSEFIMERMRVAISLGLGARKTPENTCQMIRCALGEWQVDLDLGIADNFGNTLLSSLAQAAGFLEGTSHADEVHELVREVLREATSKEAELHLPARCPFSGLYYQTPLLGLVGESLHYEGFTRAKRSSTRRKLRKSKNAMLRWLEDLQLCGVDLASYGREEQFFLAQDTSRREFRLSEGVGAFPVRLIGFDSGPSLQDWRLYWSQETDELANDLWTLVEPEEDIATVKSMPVPGAWIDDDTGDDDDGN